MGTSLGESPCAVDFRLESVAANQRAARAALGELVVGSSSLRVFKPTAVHVKTVHELLILLSSILSDVSERSVSSSDLRSVKHVNKRGWINLVLLPMGKNYWWALLVVIKQHFL